MKLYYPYKATDGKHKYYIITNTGKRIYFGDIKYQHYTEGHLDEERKDRYINRHKKREALYWNNPDKASYWSLKYLWSYPTKEEAYSNIKKDLKKLGLIIKN